MKAWVVAALTVFVSAGARAEISDVMGTLQSVKCDSIFEGQTNERIRTSKNDGTGELQLKATWEKPGRKAFAYFDVDAATIESDDNVLYVAGYSSKGTKLELNINLANAPEADAEMWIDGEAQDFLKLVCEAQIAD